LNNYNSSFDELAQQIVNQIIKEWEDFNERYEALERANDNHSNEILAYGMVYTHQSNGGISTWEFVHRQVYLWVGYSGNFRSKEYFLPEMLKS